MRRRGVSEPMRPEYNSEPPVAYAPHPGEDCRYEAVASTVGGQGFPMVVCHGCGSVGWLVPQETAAAVRS